MQKDPANRIQDYLVFGEFGGVNAAIEDSSTFTFLSSERMQEIFQHEIKGCYLYSRHTNPTNESLAKALALLEGTEACKVTSSGMAAIFCTIAQLCGSGDEILSNRTIYGGTYALFKNFLPKFGIYVNFTDFTNLEQIKLKITAKTKVLYFETLSNPLLEVADIREIRKIADENNLIIVVDNTFTPMIISPKKLGADIVVNSLTKYINGASDCIAGAICAGKDFIMQLSDVNSGASMLVGPVLDPLRAASIMKNMHTLHIRMQQHSKNAMFLAENIEKLGISVHYPGLPSHPQHELFAKMLNPGYGYGGMITINILDAEKASELLVMMQKEMVGYFAVSLGFYKTLFSSPGKSTSSEIPKELQDEMGMSEGLIRFSVGLDNDMGRTFERIKKCMNKLKII